MADPVIVGQDPIVRKVAQLAERLAHTTHPIFVEGEQGVGREHLARFLHARGPRAAAPFSILDFGDVARGASLNELVAIRDKAVGGTLLLKSCDLIPPGEIAPAVALIMEASDSTRFVVSAARRDSLDVSIGVPTIAERIGALTLFLPPLRTRRADIPELAYYLVDRWADEAGRQRVKISDTAMLSLWRHDWPGNLRELRGELVAAVGRSDGGMIGARHLALRVHPQPQRRGGGSGAEAKNRMLLSSASAVGLSIL